MKTIMEKLDRIPFNCPVCHYPIVRDISENNIISINNLGEVIGLTSQHFEDMMKCSNCYIDLSDITRYDTTIDKYVLYSHGCDFINKEKCIKRLEYNPFGGIE